MKKSSIMKALSSVLVVCMLLSMFVVSAYAETRLEIKADSPLYFGIYSDTNVVLGFSEGNTVAELLTNFESADSIIVTKDDVALTSTDKVGTGVKLQLNGEEAYVVVKGDVDGDGVVNTTDYARIKSFFYNIYTIDGIEFIAADADESGKIDTTDYSRIKNYLLGSFDLYPEMNGDSSDDTSAADPSVDDSSVADPSVDDSSVTDPSVDDSSVDDSSVDDSSVEDPSIDDSSVTDPSVDDSSEDDSSEDVSADYILNIKNKKIHIPTCSSVAQTKEENKQAYVGDIETLLEQGYTICGSCKAGQTEDSSDDSSVDSSVDTSVDSSADSSDDSTVDPSDDSSVDTSVDSSDDVSADYILNIKNKKIHIPTCSSVAQTSEANKQAYVGDIETLLEQGYTICGSCKAGQTEDSSDDSSVDSSVDSSDDSSIDSSVDSSDDSSIDSSVDSSDDSSVDSSVDSSDDSTVDSSVDSSAEAAFEIVTEPAVDTAYKFVLTQANIGTDLYFTGAKDGHYLATSDNVASAVDVYLEETEGGYFLYFYNNSVKTYINIVERDDSPGKVTLKLEEAANCVYTFDSTLNILIANVADNDYWLGTYKSFATMSASKISYISGDNASAIGVSQFPAYLVTIK